MKLYIHVENGEVDLGPVTLPKNWKYISGLDGMTDEELSQFGWIPCEGEPPVYDPRYQSLSAPAVFRDDEGWFLNWDIVDRELTEFKKERLAEIRAEARSLIIPIANEDRQRNLLAQATTLTGMYGPRKDWGPEVPSQIVSKWDAGAEIWSRIEAIRNASDEAEAAIQSATTPEEAANVTANWPE